MADAVNSIWYRAGNLVPFDGGWIIRALVTQNFRYLAPHELPGTYSQSVFPDQVEAEAEVDRLMAIHGIVDPVWANQPDWQ